MCSTLIEHILHFLYTIVIENLCLSVLLSKNSVTNVLYSSVTLSSKPMLLSKTYVTTPLCSYVTLSLSVFFCLTQKPHPNLMG